MCHFKDPMSIVLYNTQPFGVNDYSKPNLIAEPAFILEMYF